MKKIKVIGGGFSGLSIAYYLAKKGIEVDLFEKSNRLGGLLGSQKNSWALVEHAANGFLASDELISFCNDLGVRLVQANKEHRKRYIYRGRPRQIPLSALETTRLAVGILRRKKPICGQTAKDWSSSIFGFGASEYLIGPGMAGVFGTDLSQLSASLLYDYFFKYRNKRKRGSLRGLCAPEQGMQSFIDILAKALKNLGVEIHLESEERIYADEPVVIATNAKVASELLINRDEWLSDQLANIKYLPLTSVTLGFKDAEEKLEGFGCLFPHCENFNSLGVLFNTSIFPHRGPYQTETYILPFCENRQDALLQKIQLDRQKLYRKASVQVPDEVQVHSWSEALPLYDVNLENFLNKMILPQNVFLTGNYLGRIGLTKILEHNKEIADRIEKF